MITFYGSTQSSYLYLFYYSILEMRDEAATPGGLNEQVNLILYSFLFIIIIFIFYNYIIILF